LFVGNCGLANNVTYEFLNETFNQFGNVVDIIMQKKKSYAFIIYEDKNSTKLAIENLQSKIINTNSQTPICFYLFAVDKVPDLSLDSIYKQCDNLPDGLKYFQNFIDDSYAQELVTFLETHNTKQDLKKRCVKHFGYEFRYGTSDCDENKPLTEPDLQMPKICDKLIEKMLNENLIKNAPDQMTVNFYETGQGIPPHIDNIVAFNEFIISLSLCSSVLMEFRQAETKKFSKLNLEPNSLLVLTGDSRYKWSHLIAERKHDLVLNNDECLTVRKREKRISLTFRKVIFVLF
jgi:alkylated DNA repair protein alkB homolog 8